MVCKHHQSLAEECNGIIEAGLEITSQGRGSASVDQIPQTLVHVPDADQGEQGHRISNLPRLRSDHLVVNVDLS